MEKRFLVLNQSRITSFMMCPRFYEVRHLRGLDRGTIALQIGSATHKLLEQYYDKRERGEDFEPSEEPPPNTSDAVWDPALKLFYAYRRTFHNETLTIIRPEIVAKARFGTFKTSEAVYEVYLIATLDGIVQYEGGMHLMEYKTTRYIGSTGLDRFMNDYQLSTYTWIAKKALELDLDGCVCNLLPKEGNPQPLRAVVIRTAHQLLEWERTTAYYITNIIKCMEANYFPQSQNSCINWGRACIYMDYCMTGEPTNLIGLEEREDDYADAYQAELEAIGGSEE